MQRLLALCALAALPLSACSPSDGFWDRSPSVQSARAAPPPATPLRQANRPRSAPRRAPQAAPRRAPRRAPRFAPAPPQTRPAPRYTPPAAQAPARPAQPQARRGSGATPEDWQTLTHVNEIRRRRGLRPFSHNPQLFVAAYDHSAEQRRYNYMGHGSPIRGRNQLAARMRLAGYHGKAFAEVVAKGYRTVPGVVRGWMNSPGHRDILLDPKLTEAAFSRLGDIWTGNFGTPFPAPRVQRPQYVPRNYTTPQDRAPQYRTPQRPAARPAPRAMPRFSPPAPSKPSVTPPPAELMQRAPLPPPPPRMPQPPAARPTPPAAPTPSCGSGMG